MREGKAVSVDRQGDAMSEQGKLTPWVACHDTLVCAGAKQIQKWCVREGNDKGPLVAVTLTKEVAFALAAAPAAIEALELLQGFDFRLDDSPHGKEIRRRACAAIAIAKEGRS